MLTVRDRRQGIERRATWMPDPSIMSYVRGALTQCLGIDVDTLPPHWLPVIITGTMDWVGLCQWWIFKNTGVFKSDETYKWVFEHRDEYEFDPQKLLVFRKNEKGNKIHERVKAPGISGKEREECLPFIRHDIFESWLRDNENIPPQVAAQFIPSDYFIEIVMWATFIWLLDKHGQEWLRSQNQIFACVHDYGVAYLSLWGDGELLSPEEMTCTQRPHGTCWSCGEMLWCVQGIEIDAMWKFTCNHCALMLETTSNYSVNMDAFEMRQGRCPQWNDKDGRPGGCRSTCKHSGTSQETVWKELEALGSKNVENYKEQMRLNGGRNLRQQDGQTLQDIINYYEDPTKRLQ